MNIIRPALVIAAAGVTCFNQVKTPKAMITQRMTFKSVTDDLDFPYQSDTGAWPGGFNTSKEVHNAQGPGSSRLSPKQQWREISRTHHKPTSRGKRLANHECTFCTNRGYSMTAN
jgi:hypothetical protein